VKAITQKDNLKTIYNCVHIEVPEKNEEADRTMILTVGIINTEQTYFLKGIDTFVAVARLLPEIPFCIAGFNQQRLAFLQKDFPVNVKVVGNIDHNQLSEFYLRTKIYCQFSRSESFGIALTEAMLHGCIPVVTNEGGMPEVVGDNGFIIKREINLIAGKIKELVLNDDEFDFSRVKKRIQTQFSYSARAGKILQIISDW
jgi:glycosyltransferase involved in cell wall biosynthesis